MPKIKVNNISLYYELKGQGETLILVSGFGNDHTIWQEVVQKFSAHYQVLVLDNRGAGQSDAPAGGYTIDQMADDIAKLCAKLNISQAHIVGNSMGGFICQNLAYRYPKLVKTVTISNASTSIHSGFQVYVKAQLALLKAGVPLKALIQASCSWAFSYQYLSRPGNLKKIVQKTLNNPYPFSLKGYKGQHAAVGSFDSQLWAKKITMPVLVLGSDQDLIFLESTVKALAQEIPQAEYQSFSQCGHIPQMEYPEKFVEVVHRFIVDSQ